MLSITAKWTWQNKLELTAGMACRGDSSVTDATPGEPAVLKDDNDGFRDLARAPRKTRQAKGGRREEGVPEKAHGHKGGRVEEGSRGQFRCLASHTNC